MGTLIATTTATIRRLRTTPAMAPIAALLVCTALTTGTADASRASSASLTAATTAAITVIKQDAKRQAPARDDYVRMALLGVLADDTNFDPMNPEVPGPNRAELERMATVLRLTADETEIVESLLEGALDAAFARAISVWDTYRDDLEAAEENPEATQAIMRQMSGELQSAMGDVLNMLTIFEQDLIDTLDAETMERWPIYIAGVLRRDAFGGTVRPIGTNLDIHHLVSGIEPMIKDAALQARLDQQVQEWSLAMESMIDRKISVRNEQQGDRRGRFSEDPEEAQAYRDRQQSRFEREMKITLEVAELNLQFLEMIRMMLPENERTALDRAFNSEFLPPELAASRADRFITSLLKRDDLNGMQEEALNDILEMHRGSWMNAVRYLINLERRLTRSMNDVLDTPIHWADPRVILRNQIVQMEQGLIDAPDPDDLANFKRQVERYEEVWQQNNRLMRIAIDQAIAVLTAEQRAGIEQPPIRPVVNVVTVIEDLRNRAMAGGDITSTREIEFEGGIVRIENGLGTIIYDDLWLEEGRPLHHPRVFDIDPTDNVFLPDGV